METRKNSNNQWEVKLDAGWVRFGSRVMLAIPQRLLFIKWKANIPATIERIDPLGRSMVISPDVMFKDKIINFVEANRVVKEIIDE